MGFYFMAGLAVEHSAAGRGGRALLLWPCKLDREAWSIRRLPPSFRHGFANLYRPGNQARSVLGGAGRRRDVHAHHVSAAANGIAGGDERGSGPRRQSVSARHPQLLRCHEADRGAARRHGQSATGRLHRLAHAGEERRAR